MIQIVACQFNHFNQYHIMAEAQVEIVSIMGQEPNYMPFIQMNLNHHFKNYKLKFMHRFVQNELLKIFTIMSQK